MDTSGTYEKWWRQLGVAGRAEASGMTTGPLSPRILHSLQEAGVPCVPTYVRAIERHEQIVWSMPTTLVAFIEMRAPTAS